MTKGTTRFTGKKKTKTHAKHPFYKHKKLRNACATRCYRFGGWPVFISKDCEVLKQGRIIEFLREKKTLSQAKSQLYYMHLAQDKFTYPHQYEIKMDSLFEKI